jgi:hypothetical protein
MSRCKQDMLDAGERLVPRTCPVHGMYRCRPIAAEPSILTSLAQIIELAGLKVYVAGPMRGIPEFNFPAFHAAADALKQIGCVVFNPAAKDNERHGTDISKGNATGDEAIASAQHGFNLREALSMDLAWICAEADAIALLPGWKNSKGATAEHATAVALGLKVVEL